MGHPNDRIYQRLEPEDPVKSEEYIKVILERYHIDPEKPEYQLTSHWKDIVGDSIAAISVCSGCKDGIAEVKCGHPAQIQLLKINKREILKNIESMLPELKIKDLKISLGKV